jgi:hypothetical protein
VDARRTLVLSDLTMGIRLARDLRTYLGQIQGREDCVRLLKDHLAQRDESFLWLIERSVFGNARSPYRHLMTSGKVGFADVTQWVRRGGVEGALAELYDRDVYVTLDEFKGRQPIRRAALELPVRAEDFDNPLLTAHYAPCHVREAVREDGPLDGDQSPKALTRPSHRASSSALEGTGSL